MMRVTNVILVEYYHVAAVETATYIFYFSAFECTVQYLALVCSPSKRKYKPV